MSIFDTSYERAVLLDSGALFALMSEGDQYHELAQTFFEILISERIPLYTTNAVILETYRLILHKLGIQKALDFLEQWLSDPTLMTIERMSVEDEENAREVVRKYSDQDISLTDAVNFAVMSRKGILKMFGFDNHCLILGFQRVPE